MDNHRDVRRYSDEMYCTHCRLRWDVNDPEPPPCTVSPAPKEDRPSPAVRKWQKWKQQRRTMR